ncbi:MAG: ACT domain-containing protein [Prevotella sp.]|nr:ACT domain-containing protein [Prevotella sp.]
MRKAKPKKRVILPDPVFNDTKVSKFVNHLMYDGKKSVSYEIFYNALEAVKAKMKDDEKSALEIWKQALDINILDISQTVMQEFFVMTMLADMNGATQELVKVRAQLDELGKELGVTIRIQSEDIFTAMHTV